MAEEPAPTAGADQKLKLPPKINEATLRRLILQTFGRTRWTQDSPIVPDVWIKCVRNAEIAARERIKLGLSPEDPAAPVEGMLDLLLTPWTGTTPGAIATALRSSLGDEAPSARIAQGASRVVVNLDFISLIVRVMPITGWWEKLDPKFKSKRSIDGLARKMKSEESINSVLTGFGPDMEFYRYAALVGLVRRLQGARSNNEILEIYRLARKLSFGHSADVSEIGEDQNEEQETGSELTVEDVRSLINKYQETMSAIPRGFPVATSKSPLATSQKPPRIFLINVNRTATSTIFESRNTIKADAAERVFKISTDGIAFAVIDCGIDAAHPAFQRKPDPAKKKPGRALGPLAKEKRDFSQSRVAATYDFTILREVISSEADLNGLPERNRKGIRKRLTAEQLEKIRLYLSNCNQSSRDLDWALVEPLIRISHDDETYIDPCADHGTHVAGILAADWHETDGPDPIVGMCPNLTLYDLRVFSSDGGGDEFAILAALEFVAWLNRDRKNPVVHGVNLSLALIHDVDSFACGQTPVCEVCNYLVGLGTVVVAAAGNSGFDSNVKKQSMGNGYRMISITDPGNADAVITVGSTHRRDPHAYGVSYFSARGPTGDGRRKPDILAPGEKIVSSIRDKRSQRMDGTSMAAPHVSGAAAMLMARYPELIGRPQRIKEILINSATDLKREPYFQGAGLLDVLRALQSI